MNYIQLAKQIVNKACKKGADGAEVFIINSEDTKITVRNSDIEDLHQAQQQGLALRVFKDHKLGFYYTTDLDKNNIENITSSALQNSSENDSDELGGLNEAKDNINVFPNIYDQELSDISISKKIELTKMMENEAKKIDKRVNKTEYVAFEEKISHLYLVNSLGFENSYKESICGGIAELIAEEDGAMETGSGFSFTTHFNNFDPCLVGREAAEDAISMLGAGKLQSQNIPVILSPRTAISFLSVIAPMFSAEAVQKNKSKLMGKLSQEIASPKVTIIDDGTQDMKIGSFPFDGEGTKSQKTILVNNGVLENYLYHNYSARKDKKTSTGNAARISFKTSPNIFPSNLYISPGNKNPEDLIKGINKGLYLTRVIGLHIADPISGDFSLGGQGILIESGQKTKPVRKFALAGNLIDLLTNILDLANDLRFLPGAGNIGAPTILINEMKISG